MTGTHEFTDTLLESVREVFESKQASSCYPNAGIVERASAWLNRRRRMPKDFGNRTRTATAFVQLISIRLMLRKLRNSS